jgi:Nucleotidyl transferase AbiEii toxin, Type IV TA system
MKKAVVNLPASVRQRLLNLATERKEEFGLVLSRYGLERFLYRLSVSPHCDLFVLKGVLLLQVWTGESYRPTRDLDLLGKGVSNLSYQKIFSDESQTPNWLDLFERRPHVLRSSPQVALKRIPLSLHILIITDLGIRTMAEYAPLLTVLAASWHIYWVLVEG